MSEDSDFEVGRDPLDWEAVEQPSTPPAQPYDPPSHPDIYDIQETMRKNAALRRLLRMNLCGGEVKQDHLLADKLLKGPVKVLVVGCGGSGSSMVSGLPLLHQAMLAYGHPGGLDVTIADGDLITETNCVRQPFSLSEVGLYKATVLATRINMFWGLGWHAINEYVNDSWTKRWDLVISCVDTRAARKTVFHSETYRASHYSLDLGNNADTGQFVLGQPYLTSDHTDWGGMPRKKEVRLPTVAMLFPEIVNSRLDRKDKLPSCSAIEALERQEPFVNQTLACHALAMLARLFRYGRLDYHGGFVNLATGKVQCLPVDPSIWDRMITTKGKVQ